MATSDRAEPDRGTGVPSSDEDLMGGATGIGSWPGTDVMSVMRTQFDELGEPPHLPYLTELPARGPGADMIGRSAALLVDLPVDLQPSGWRLVDHPGRDQNRAASWLRQDLDVLAEVADGYSGRVKLQATGPWTLAANLWLPRLERVVVDPGAVRDLIESLAEGLAVHVAEVARQLPGSQIVVQIDEPSLDAVRLGSLPTASGFGRLRAIEASVLVEGLETVLDAVREAGAVLTVLHSCVSQPPIEVLARSGAGAISLDVTRLGSGGWERVAEAVEGGGTALWAGAISLDDDGLAPTGGASPAVVAARPAVVAERIWKPWRRLGLNAQDAAKVVLTPTCGLAGASSPATALQVLRLAKKASGVLAEKALS